MPFASPTGWAFSEAWLEETSTAVEAAAPRPRRRIAARAGPRSRRAPPRARGPAAVLPLLPVERRGPTSFCPARRRRSGVGPRRPRRWSASSTMPGLVATKVEDADLARFLEGEGRLVRLGRRLRRRRRRLRGGEGPRRHRVRVGRVRSRWRGSATSPASAGATRSSSSSGWTSTASRVGSVTGGFCVARARTSGAPTPAPPPSRPPPRSG